MSYEDDLQEEIDRLKRIIGNKNNTIEELQNDIRKSNNKLDSAEYRISNELEPRIKREERAYDSYVSSPEAHMSEDEATCYHYCETDQCGPACPLFGDLSECTENLSDEELLKDYIINDAVEQVIFDRGLWREKLIIDWIEDSKDIKKHRNSAKVVRKNRLNRLLFNIKQGD